MKKTIYFTLTLFALIAFASSCNQNNEKIIYVKVSLPNGWTPNPVCDATAFSGSCGSYVAYAGGGNYSSTGNTALQINNNMFSETDEFLMDLNVGKNLVVSVLAHTSWYLNIGDPPTYVSNTFLVEVFVNGSVYESRTLTLDGTGASNSFNVIIE
jgi:hypothetical protein